MFLTNINNLNFFMKKFLLKNYHQNLIYLIYQLVIDVEHLFNEKKFNIELKSHP